MSMESTPESEGRRRAVSGRERRNEGDTVSPAAAAAPEGSNPANPPAPALPEGPELIEPELPELIDRLLTLVEGPEPLWPLPAQDNKQLTDL